MTNPEADTPAQANAPVDPKAQMRAALDAKKSAQHKHADPAAVSGKSGGQQGKQGGKRQFRRKAGG